MKRYVIMFVFLFAVAASAKKKEIPPAPLPAAVTSAKSAFLLNGGGSNLAFDAFYQEMKSWGKYQIVGSPEQADLVITLLYSVEATGDTVPVRNSYTGQVMFYDSVKDPQMKLSIVDAKSKDELWSTIAHRKLVMRWNVDKEIAKTAVMMVDELRARSQ